MRLNKLIAIIPLMIMTSAVSHAQSSEQDADVKYVDDLKYVDDEIVAYGQTDHSNHKGMNAFFDGDFETAEIIFEREFLSLKRGRTSIENAAFNAQSNQIQSEQLSTTTGSSIAPTGPSGTTGFTPSSTPNTPTAPSSNLNKKEKTGVGVLTDGVVTYHDFAFSKYMAGLSEIKLGKIDEAKKSLKSSLFHDHTNFDARMRLGLIYLQEKDYENAANQLQKLDDQRKKCIQKSCRDKDLLTDAAVTLAKHINTSLQ